MKRLLFLMFAVLVAFTANSQNTFIWTRHSPTSVANIGTVVDGKVYYDLAANKFMLRQNGVWYDFNSIAALGQFWKISGTTTATGNMIVSMGENTLSQNKTSSALFNNTAFYMYPDSVGFFAQNTAQSGIFSKLRILSNFTGVELAHRRNDSLTPVGGGVLVNEGGVTLSSYQETVASSSLAMTPLAISVDGESNFLGIQYGSNIRSNFTGFSLVDRDYVLAFAKTYTTKQTLAGSATVAGANFANSADMSSGLADGDFRYNSTSDIWKGRTNGTILPFVQGPETSTNNSLALFSGTTGSLMASPSNATFSSNTLSIPNLSVTGNLTASGSGNVDLNTSGFVTLQGSSASLNTTGGEGFAIDDTDGIKVHSTILEKGMSYEADFSANNTSNPRWIPDKAYVDAAAGSIGGSIADAAANTYRVAMSNGSNTIQGTDELVYNDITPSFYVGGTSGSRAVLHGNGGGLELYNSSNSVSIIPGANAAMTGSGTFSIGGTTAVAIETVTFNSTGIDGNSGGMKHKRQSVTIFPSAETEQTITWTTAFSNANYTPTVSILETNSGDDVDGMVSIVIIEQVAASITVRIKYDGATGFDAFLNAIAIHD
jgi:hypothetical protein